MVDGVKPDLIFVSKGKIVISVDTLIDGGSMDCIKGRMSFMEEMEN